MHNSPPASKSVRARTFALLAVIGIGVAACSGGGDSAPTTTTAAPTTSERPTTTLAPTTSTTTTLPATTTTEPPPPVFPLTGVLIDDLLAAVRPALVVKIDNAPAARPQTGFNSADIVVEEIINDNFTRFAMVFHSRGSNPVGPIRSGRLQDVELFSNLNRPLFAWSGGNGTVTEAIRNSTLIDIGPNRASAYFRSDERSVPSNLYSNTDRLWQETPPDALPPQQLFFYRAADAPVAGRPSNGVVLTLDSIDVQWDWDAAAGLYRRTMEGRPHVDAADGSQVTTNNVVVMVVNYAQGISGSPDAQTIGTGEVYVFTGGNVIAGTWSRADMFSAWTLTDLDGNPIELTPGRSFIELPRPFNTTIIEVPAA